MYQKAAACCLFNGVVSSGFVYCGLLCNRLRFVQGVFILGSEPQKNAT